MQWVKYTILLDDPQLTHVVSDLLMSLGADSVLLESSTEEAIFEPEPDKTPLWQATRLSAYFEEASFDEDHLQHQLETFMGRVFSYHCEIIDDEPFDPQPHLHTIEITPRFKIYQNPEHKPPHDHQSIVLTPGLAFGTGEHPTTKLCLEWLTQQSLKGKHIVDYGCGSGILSIASLKLGADKVTAIDIDTQALEATKSNAHQNKCDLNKLDISKPSDKPLQADIILANILLNSIVSLLPKFNTMLKPGDALVISGVLEEQIKDIKSNLKPYFVFKHHWVQKNWALVEVHKCK